MLAGSAVLPFLIATCLCVWWTRSETLILGGDEPHYLIMARSVALDLDFDLKNNYEEEALTAWIYPGPLVPHAFQGGPQWPPYHSPGLGLLLALPFGYAGLDGARLALLTWAVLVPLALFVFLREHLTFGTCVLLSIALGLSVPLAYGSSQVYPDLPGAAILTVATLACLEWSARRSPPDTALWAITWSLVGFLPWLQSRFLAPWLLLVMAGAAMVLRAPRSARWRLLIGLLPAFLGVLALVWFNQTHYGAAFGPPRWNELTRSPARAAMIFLGLHFDRSQGLFVQQPLWLLGLVAAAPFARARPIAAAWIALLYLATIVPPSMQMGRYGGDGPVGRYAWAAAFLWMVPIGSLLTSGGVRAARWFRIALVLSVGVQLVLAAHWWIAGPYAFRPNLAEDVSLRDSLPPAVFQHVLPSFYFWDFTSYWRYPPNLVAIAAAILLVATGIGWARTRMIASSVRPHAGP